MEHRKAVSLGPLFLSLLAVCCLYMAALFVTACGSMSGTVVSGTGAVTTFVSDPATCQAPNGSYTGVWVAITDVQAHTNSSAGPNDSGWVDLTPTL
jgi:hypothetical protein